MVPLLGLSGTTENFLMVFGVLLASHAVLNHVGIRTVARLNDFSAWYHVAGVAIVVLALAFFAPKQPVSWLFTKTFTTVTDKPYWYAFLGGLLQAQWTYTGYDASAHTIEETRNARISAPWGMYLSVAVSGLFGYLMLAFVTLAIKDLNATAAAANPFVYIFEQALGGRFGHVVLWIVTLAMWFCGLSCVTSTSRMIFAFFRDHGLPLSSLCARVRRRFLTAAAGVLLACALAFFLVCLIFGTVEASRAQNWVKPFEFSTVYQAV